MSLINNMKLISEKPENILNRVKSDFNRGVKRSQTDIPIERQVKRTISRGIRQDKARNLTQPKMFSEPLDLLQEIVFKNTNIRQEKPVIVNSNTLESQTSPITKIFNQTESQSHHLDSIPEIINDEDENLDSLPVNNEQEEVYTNPEGIWSNGIENQPYDGSESEVDFEPFPLKF